MVALLLSLITSPVLASSVYVSGADASQVEAVRSSLIQAGIAQKEFSEKRSDDSVIIALSSHLEAEIQAVKSGAAGRGALISYGGGQRSDLAAQVSEHLPKSRVYAETNIQTLAARVKEILREQVRLKAGISGIGTIPSPEVGQVFAADDIRTKHPTAPLGSAVMTRAGIMEATGVKVIIHTASGAMTRDGEGFEPTVESVRNSLINAVALARDGGHKRVAVPIIGGSIFISRIGMELCDLVDSIVDVLIEEKAGLKFVFTARGGKPKEAECIAKSFKRLNAADLAHFELANKAQWSIVKFKEHQATAVINSANMEVLFGGGLSAVVADAANGIFPADRDGENGTSIRSYGEFAYDRDDQANNPSTKIDNEARAKVLLFRTLMP